MSGHRLKKKKNYDIWKKSVSSSNTVTSENVLEEGMRITQGLEKSIPAASDTPRGSGLFVKSEAKTTIKIKVEQSK